LLAVAVNVTDVPAHMLLPGLDVIETEGVTVVLTVIVIVLLAAVAGDTQEALLETTQVIVLPFVKEASE